MNSLKSEELVKIYSKRRVVNNVSIFVNEGEIVGLLGPNGAGKTTTFYMMTGMIRPDEGRVVLTALILQICLCIKGRGLVWGIFHRSLQYSENSLLQRILWLF